MRDYTLKVENSGVSADGRLSAAEDSVRFHELVQAVSQTGIALDAYGGPDVDKTMLAQAICRAAAGGGYVGTCTGSANTYAVTKLGSYVVSKALFAGMLVVTTANAANTGATTVNVFGLGSKKLMTWTANGAGAACVGGELQAGRMTAWQYSTAADGGAGAWIILPWANAIDKGPAPPPGESRMVSSLFDYEIVDYTRTATSMGAMSKAYTIPQQRAGSKCLLLMVANARIRNAANSHTARGRMRVYYYNGSSYVDAGAAERLITLLGLAPFGGNNPYIEGAVVLMTYLENSKVDAGNWKVKIYGSVDDTSYEMTSFNSGVLALEIVEG